MKPDDIAIVGMACLYPGAPDLDTYWQNILSKVDAITDPPPGAWDVDVFYDPDSTANDRVYCKRGGFLGPVAYFDPLEHNIMPLAVEGGEPDQWLALRVARAAFADAGYRDEIPDRHRTAVILGKGNYPNRGNATGMQHGLIVQQTLEILKTLNPDYTEADLQLIKEELKRRLPPFNSDTAPGLIPNIMAGRIANRLDLMGPSYTVDAACASSLVAVDAAVRGLRNREYDMALVGGVHCWTPVPMLMLFSQLGALSHREQIRPFDKDADGTILSEGVGMVVLKRREDAERDGNRTYAVIKGVGTSSDGRGMAVMTPRLEGEVLALQRTYEMTGITPRTVGLIEAHGTATLVGDAAEVEALTRVVGDRDGGLPWCALGSVKSMIGHTMPAAGVAGLIKAALALYHKVLPPTLNVDEPNPRLDLEKSPFYINTETRPWIHHAHDAPRRAGVNAFGFGGINAHVILEEYPATDDTAFPSHHLPWDTEVFILSAGSRPELIQRIQELQQFLGGAPAVNLKDLAYTLNVESTASDAQHSTRLSVVASSIEDLQQKLGRAAERLSDPKVRQIKEVQGVYFFEQPLADSGQLAFIFPGEGSQYVNMLADLCIHFPEVRERFDSIDRVFAEHSRNFVPSDFIFPRPAFSEAERETSEERLWQMDGAVEAVLTANRALFDLLSRLEIHPDAVVGHSTGEYSAMLVTGMIDLADETRIGQFATELNGVHRQAAVEGDIERVALVAVGADAETVSAIIGQSGEIHVAMDNCPHQTVIVGKEDAVERAVEQLGSRGLIYERLPFDRPYHTPLFESFAARLRTFFAQWLVSTPRVKTYSCTTRSPFSADPAQIQEVAVDHWMRPVEFRKTIEAMYDDGLRIFVEVGPRGNLTAFVDDILRGRPHLAVPANVMHRSGITQLNHLVGILAAQGVPMRLDYLYARRSPRKLNLAKPDDLAESGRKSRRQMKLATGWPEMNISNETAARLQFRNQATPVDSSSPDASTRAPATPPVPPASQQARIALAPTSASQQAASPRPPTADRRPQEETVSHAEVHSQPQAVVSPQGRRASASQVTSAYLQTMEQFLAVQQEVMQAFLSGQTGAPVSTIPAALPAGSERETESGAAEWREDREATEQEQIGAQEPLQPSTPDSPAEPSPLPEDENVDQPAGVEAGSLGVEAIGSMLLQLVSERTGYPIEMLDLSLDLEADLGIDSIKRVEILGSFQQQTNLLQAEDMEALASRKTLQDVISFLAERSERPGTSELAPPADTARETTTTAVQAVPPMPFIGSVVSLTPGEELVARYEISLDEALFLRDHTLGRQVSVADPELMGLPVMPLTMSMEMLAEAAAVLAPGKRLIGMRDIRAYRWIMLEGDKFTLELVAKRKLSAPRHEIHAYIREADAADVAEGAAAKPIVEGTAIFDDTYPEPPVAGEFALRQERPSKWAPEELYEEGMFHGPAFRGVVSMDRWGEDGAEATLEVLPADGLFARSNSQMLLTDPVLLDQPGQVVAFWMTELLERSHMILPYSLEALHLYGPPLSPRADLDSGRGERVKCQARIALVGDTQMRSDLDIARQDGRVWARLVGWEDRRFELPEPFMRFQLSPRQVVLSRPWLTPVPSSPGFEEFQVYRLSVDDFPAGFFTAHGGIWLRVLIHSVLSRRERAAWHSLKTPEPRRLEWLLGRVVAKDAVRQHLRQRYGMVLCPADIEVLPDENGRPVVQGAWLGDLPSAPILSLSHSGGTAVAVVGDGRAAAGVGVDIEYIGRRHAGIEKLAFTPAEQALLSSVADVSRDSWTLRLWCAKEAVAKALGEGMVGGPQALVVKNLDPDTGIVQVGLAGELASRFPEVNGGHIVAYTTLESDLIVATSLFTREGE
jgi:acyl transferase domain-containing protein/phosphopantetheinyl transferase